MNVRVHEVRRSLVGQFIAWTTMILGLVGAAIGISELRVVFTVSALIVMAVAGMYLLARRTKRIYVSEPRTALRTPLRR